MHSRKATSYRIGVQGIAQLKMLRVLFPLFTEFHVQKDHASMMNPHEDVPCISEEHCDLFLLSSLPGTAWTAWTAPRKFELVLTGGLLTQMPPPLSRPGGLPIWHLRGLGYPYKSVSLLNQINQFLKMLKWIQAVGGGIY